MKMAWKIPFSLLLWPISVMAQDPSPSSQPDPPVQSPQQVEDAAPASDGTPAPSPTTPPPIPITTQTQAFLSLRRISQPPIFAAYVPMFNVSAGYSVTSAGLPASGRAALNGINVSISANSGKRIGAKLDLGYARAPNVLNSGRRMDMLSYLVGPVFSISHRRSLSTYAQLLAGGARVAGPVSKGNGALITGYVHYPAWAFGGGAEYSMSPAFGFRVSVDYLHTHFFNSTGATRGQNDLRVVNSFVYYLGAPLRPHRLVSE
jgi:hypothetical protein